MITAFIILASIGAASVYGQRKLTPLLDRMEEDVRSDEYWRPL